MASLILYLLTWTGLGIVFWSLCICFYDHKKPAWHWVVITIVGGPIIIVWWWGNWVKHWIRKS